MREEALYIRQGELAVGQADEDVISTILGSCVSVCLWDPKAKVGGMNHMILPDAPRALDNMSTGVFEMERLINEIVGIGGDRRRFRAKVFGGASMLDGITDIGQRNVDFANGYLSREEIVCDASSTGGDRARRIRFWPASGFVKQKLVKGSGPVPEAVPAVLGHGVEFF